MKHPETVWKTNTDQYSWGSKLHMGRVIVGRTDRESGSRSDTPETPRWKAVCLLPGIRTAEERYVTEDEAKARLERQVRVWFDWIEQS